MASDPLAGQVEVLGAIDPKSRRTTRMGVGLLLSLLVGAPALAAGLDGSASFEWAVLRLLLSVVASVTAVLLVGSLFDLFATMAAARQLDGIDDGARIER